MKKILIALLLLIASSSYSIAQNGRWRGFALGADRDTLLYIIASPFDNWYLNVGGGIQTFIGNEVDASARRNKLNYNISAELGKWIIPDLAVSLRLGFMNLDGQSQYSLHPFIDYTNTPTYDKDGVTYYEYESFHAHALTLMGFVTLDWTNLFNGYERGKRKKLHWYSPIGLGGSMLFGKEKNPNPKIKYEVGDFRHNFELAFSFRFGAEYCISQQVALNATVELFGSESTFDWSPYDNSYSIFDIIPSVNVAAKFNLLKTITKYDPYTKTSRRETVNHEFLSFGSRNTIPLLNGKLDRLYRERDSLLNLSHFDSICIDSLNNEIARLQDEMDKMHTTEERPPINIFDELLSVNEALNLPSTIVYFQLDKYDLDYNARKRLENFSKDARNLDDTTEFYIIGAADSLTGSIRHNQKLSEHRCEVAYKLLVDTYGMNENQLIRVYAGGINVYDPKENNRMTMIIQRTPVTEEIVERWIRMSKERLK